jgi:TonB-linked SusC/RagA family outer membrane protein
MKKMTWLLLFLVSAQLVWAQKSVKGTVTDAQTGTPLPSVSVSVVGSKTGVSATTDEKGVFEVQVPSVNNSKLMITAIGYKPLVVELAGKSSLTIKLEQNAAVMDDVVVIGYGDQKKSHLTGAITKLKNDNLDEIPASSLDRMLIGKMAGVTVQNLSSETGVAPRVRVRGLSSISANADPLVVVDGHPMPDGLAMVNPFDVESVEVLKDAASSAIYGSRGANGVILITTRKGKTNKPKYTFKTYYGIKDAYELHPMMTTGEYTQKLYDEAALREQDPTVPANRKNLITPAEKGRYLGERVLLNGEATDWQNVALRDAGIYNAQLSVSGGKDIRYFISGNYQVDNGIMHFNDFNRINFRTKLDGNLSKKVRFSVNVNPSFSRTTRPTANFTDYYRFYSGLPVYHTPATAAFVAQNPQWSTLRAGDYAQPRHFSNLFYQGAMPDGSYWDSNEDPQVTSGRVNPFSSANNTPWSIANRQSNATNQYRLQTAGDLSFDLAKGLVFKTSGSAYVTYTEREFFSQRNARTDGEVNSGEYFTRKFIDLLWENTLNYTQSRGDHNFSGLLGFTAQKTNVTESQLVGLNLPSDNVRTLNQASAIDLARSFTLKNPIGLLSYLGRVTYDYKDRYLFSASLRTDGSGYFPPGEKYGWFPAVSAGWRLNNEPFLQDVSWLNNLKLRTSYGATGNNNIEPFSYLELLNPANYSFGAGTGNLNNGLAANNDILPNILTWERTYQFNAGIDVGLFNNRLSATIEYYNGVTDRLLLRQAAMSFSGSNQFWNNIGKVRNQGLELELTTTNIRNKHLTWTTSFNMAGNRNKLLELGGEPFQLNYGERNEIYAAFLGGPAVQFFGYKTAGVWLSDAQIAEEQQKGLTSSLSRYFVAGGLRFEDINGDNRIDENDRTIIGRPFPDFTWGMTHNIRYKNFDLTFVIQGVQGVDLINGDAFYNESRWYNRNYNTPNRWVSAAFPGDGKTPYAADGADWMLTDYIVENGSYGALRSAILGYTISPSKLKRLKLGGLRFYASGENLFFVMAKSYRGINPEARNTSGNYASPLIDGYQRGGFPIGRTMTIGVDINF